MNNLNGVIHLYPLTCMPEIIAQCAFDEIQKKYGIPIMTLIIDEMTGESGYITRFEAFIDMLEMKREEGREYIILPLHHPTTDASTSACRSSSKHPRS